MPVWAVLFGLARTAAPYVARFFLSYVPNLIRLAVRRGGLRLPPYVPGAPVDVNTKRSLLRQVAEKGVDFSKKMAVAKVREILSESPNAILAMQMILPAFAYLTWQDFYLRASQTHPEGYITTAGFNEALDALLDTVGFLLFADVISGADVGSDIAEELVSEVAQRAVSDTVEVAMKIKSGGMEPDVDEVRETIAEGALGTPEEIALQYLATGLNTFSAAAHAYSALLQGNYPRLRDLTNKLDTLVFDKLAASTWHALAVEMYARARGDALDTLYRIVELLDEYAAQVRSIVRDYLAARIATRTADAIFVGDYYDKALTELEALLQELETAVDQVNPCEFVAFDVLDQARQRVAEKVLPGFANPLIVLLQEMRASMEYIVSEMVTWMIRVRQWDVTQVEPAPPPSEPPPSGGELPPTPPEWPTPPVG